MNVLNENRTSCQSGSTSTRRSTGASNAPESPIVGSGIDGRKRFGATYEW